MINQGGLLFKKKEMTSIWQNNKFIPVTVLQFQPAYILRYKTLEKDGYNAIVIGIGKKELTNKVKGVKIKYAYICEFKIKPDLVNQKEVGSILDLSEININDLIIIQGISKGKGFQGVMKRHNFAGGPATHGSKFHRWPGSIGNRKPTRPNKGHPLPGRMGTDKITLKKVKICDIITLDNEKLILVNGSVPGAYNSIVKVLF